MRKFPAYKFDDVMRMDAWLFDDLLAESQRIDAQESLNMMTIVGIPHMDEKARKHTVAEYEMMAKDQQIYDEEFYEESEKKIKRILN